MKDIFAKIYQDNLWESLETRSGIGSEIAHTQEIRIKISDLLKEFRVSTLFDAPCGEFNWMKKMDLSGIDYIGSDILPELIDSNIKIHASNSITFTTLDITKDSLPQACLMLTRDCLVHFSYQDINNFLSNLHGSNIKYLLTTTFTDRVSNHDIITGDWRPLNLQIAPFCFPAPLHIINEKFQGYDSLFPDKSLALYDVKDLPTSLINDFDIVNKPLKQDSKIGRHY